MATGPKTLPFVIFLFAVQLLGQGAPATIAWQDEVPQQTVTSQPQRPSLKEECPPGFYRSPYNGACTGCTEGDDYTSSFNNLPSCLSCAVCKPGTECVDPLPRGGVRSDEAGVVADVSQGTKFQSSLVFIIPCSVIVTSVEYKQKKRKKSFL
ncbi:tumor necrosis factor receptor superfamily member 10D-like [Sapajus apella]|uniref:Tumor necrosis factor receptor superfamily member 10D-like n=1 Tax=Sapajus apella TaxID=9515 RepID=A0A6J3IPI1_SAPAP|nr:tumor necrosis factor receptor superfamily member 10D-like [Sapajus apella]